MMPVTLRQCADFTKGVLSGDSSGSAVPVAISTDTRTIIPGSLYAALVGKRFNGHDFIEEALEKGAIAVMHSQDLASKKKGAAYIRVADTAQALQDLASGIRDLIIAKVVAVTGSNGKSTTKEMISAILGLKGNVLSSQGNFNNEIGLPITVFEARDDHHHLVLEMGMRGSGQIAALTRIARPDIGVITNIRESHLEHLGSREAIAKAKGELLDEMSEGSVAVLNGDDAFCRELGSKFPGEVLWYGDNADICAEDVSFDDWGCPSFTLVTPKGAGKVTLKIPGDCQIHNALAAAATALALGFEVGDIIQGLEGAMTLPMRMEIKRSPGGWTVLNDAYNASPSSSQEALKVLERLEGGRKWAVLGDMLELGDDSRELHERLGAQAADSGVDFLITLGEWGEALKRGAEESGLRGKALFFDDLSAAGSYIRRNLRKHDVVLLKASRAVGLERLAPELGVSL